MIRSCSWILGVVGVVLWLGGAAARGGLVTLVNNGPSSNRVDMVFLGDGYTSADHATGVYGLHIQGMLDHLLSPLGDPFGRYWNFFNVHRVDLVSTESGASAYPLGIYRETALNARYYYDGHTERLLYIDQARADAVLGSALAGTGVSADIRMVTVNDTRYGGGGGRYAVYAGANASAPDLALHEVGHSFAGLADEYVVWNQPYTGPEPAAANVTTNPNPATVKWAHWLGYEDPRHPSVGPVGIFEGGEYHATGIYRPTLRSKMRTLGQPFNAVSREEIILRIYDLVRPMDAWLDNSGVIENPSALWVEVVDPDVIAVQWSINGQVVGEDAGQILDPSQLALGPGLHEIVALAYDRTLGNWVRRDYDRLRQEVRWSVQMTVAATPPLLGDVNRDGLVNSDDLGVLLAHWGTNGAVMWEHGDLNGDGRVDTDDLGVLLTNWGAAAQTLPEPGSLALLALGLVAIVLRRR